MALVKCPECGTAVSSEAAACPKCGHPIRATPAGGINPKDPIHLIGILIAVLVGIVIVVYFLQSIAARNVMP